MATLTFWSEDLTRRLDLSKLRVDNLLTQVKHAEKTAFARNEALDFDLELKKRNANLAFVVDRSAEPSCAAVAAYFIYVRTQKTVSVHKVCVLQDYRRRGIATALLKMHVSRFKDWICRKAQLWLDEAIMPAKKLYTSAGFVETDRVEGYYAPGRNGIKMVLEFL